MDLRRIVLVTWVFAYRWTLPALAYMLGRREPASVVGVRLRTTFEELGVMYLKLGQFLAVRFDLLPAAVLRELELLFENTRPMPFEVVQAAITRELGRPLNADFVWIEPESLGSASIAQVHRALTHSGHDVALKVQRPEVRAIFESDLRNLERLSALIDTLGLVHGASLLDVVHEFGGYTRREMDFLHEAATIERVHQQNSPYLSVPAVDWGLTTQRLLTMEYVPGLSLRRLLGLLESGDHDGVVRLLPHVDLHVVAERLAWGMLHQVFTYGFFQADPHPGNILIRPDGAVVLVDFGIFGELDPEQVDILSRYVEAVSLGRVDEAYRLYSRLISPSSATDMVRFRRGVKAVLRRYYRANTDSTAPQEDRHVGRLGDELLRLLYEHHVRLDLNTLLFWRGLIVLDATFLRWPGNFDLQASMQQFFRSVRSPIEDRVLETFHPARLAMLQMRGPELVQQVAFTLNDVNQRRRGPRARIQRGAVTQTKTDRAVTRLAFVGAATSAAMLVMLTDSAAAITISTLLASASLGALCILLLIER